MTNKLKVHKGSDNVFSDLKHPTPKEALIKAKMANHICRIIKAFDLSQSKLAKLLALDQPRVSDLVSGRLRRFSTQKFFDILTALDQDIEIRIRPRKTKTRAAEIKVIVALFV